MVYFVENVPLTIELVKRRDLERTCAPMARILDEGANDAAGARIRSQRSADPPSGLGRAGAEVFGIGGAGELLAHQAGQQHRAEWPVVRRDVLGLPAALRGDQDGTADGLAVDLSGLDLEETAVGVVAGEVEVLAVIHPAGGDQDRPDGPVRPAQHRPTASPPR